MIDLPVKCGSFLDETGGIDCALSLHHDGWHKSSGGGIEWQRTRADAAHDNLRELLKLAYENLSDDLDEKPMRHSIGNLIARIRAILKSPESGGGGSK